MPESNPYKMNAISPPTTPLYAPPYIPKDYEEPNERMKEMLIPSAFDHQENGEHYKGSKTQPVQFIMDNGLDFLEGSAVKYIARHRKKGMAVDIKKSIHYLRMLLEKEYGIKSKVTYSDE